MMEGLIKTCGQVWKPSFITYFFCHWNPPFLYCLLFKCCSHFGMNRGRKHLLGKFYCELVHGYRYWALKKKKKLDGPIHEWLLKDRWRDAEMVKRLFILVAASGILWWWGSSGKWWYPESCHWLHHELSAFTDKQWISCFLASLCCRLFSEPDWLVYCWLCKLPNIFSINCVSHQSICSLSVACNQNHDWYPERSQEMG